MTTRDVFGCEIATGKLDKDGYAYHGRSRAHIVAWVKVNGPVPYGLVLDHLCRRRACSAPHHLEPVTQSENEMRKGWRYRARRGVCAKGHDLRVNGVVTPEGGRVCRQCNRDASENRTLCPDVGQYGGYPRDGGGTPRTRGDVAELSARKTIPGGPK